MIGDAFGFVAPVYSTGVFLALKSGEMAADAIAGAIEAALAEQLARRALDAVATAPTAHQTTVVSAQLGPRVRFDRLAQRSFSGFSTRSLIISIVMPAYRPSAIRSS